jgi:glucose/arabinose dehydrogenase
MNAPKNTPKLRRVTTGLLASAFVLLACGTVSPAAARPPIAEAAGPPANPAPPLVSAQVKPASQAATAQSGSLGALVAAPLAVPPELRTGTFQAPPQLNLPPGFSASLFASGVTSARFMALAPGGTLLVTSQGDGKVFALPDRNADGVADEVQVWADGLRQPHGIAVHDGYLYVGETNRIVRFKLGPSDTRDGGPEAVIPELPSGGGHSTRTVGFGPDGRLFVAVGSSCNVCNESDDRRAAISVYNPDGSAGRVFMRGLRNAVGFVWRPGANDMWATTNGRDQLGDDVPLETVYQVRDGGNAGWPNCHAGPNGIILDPQFGTQGQCATVDAPAAAFQAHTAPLGLRFYDGASFPEAVRGDLFVALHGSWNRSVPAGYKIIRILFDGDTVGQAEDFATGWMANEGDRGSVWGRPVDVLVAPDGALLISDDSAGAIYRITYRAS